MRQLPSEWLLAAQYFATYVLGRDDLPHFRRKVGLSLLFLHEVQKDGRMAAFY